MKNRLKELRMEKGLTQEELGNQLGLANNTISRYETGSNEPPKFETWQKIADFFHVPTEYLLGITNDRVTLITVNDLNPAEEDAYKRITTMLRDDYPKDDYRPGKQKR